MNGVRIALIFLVLIFSGYIAGELGIVSSPIGGATQPLPPTGSGFFNALWTILAPLLWVFDSLANMFKIFTFQADIPVLVSTMIILPIGFFMSYTLIRLIRGGG